MFGEEVGVESRDVYGGVRGLERRNGDVVKKMKESREGEAQWLWRKNRGKVSGGGLRRLDFVGESPFFFSRWAFGYQGPPSFRTCGTHSHLLLEDCPGPCCPSGLNCSTGFLERPSPVTTVL